MNNIPYQTDEMMINLSRMSDYYLNCLWIEYVNETKYNHYITQKKILHQHDINILGISLATKFINQNFTNI